MIVSTTLGIGPAVLPAGLGGSDPAKPLGGPEDEAVPALEEAALGAPPTPGALTVFDPLPAAAAELPVVAPLAAVP